MLLLLIAFGLSLPTSVFAQASSTGTIGGALQDINGAVLPGVTVTVRGVTTGVVRTATTDSEGRWTVPALNVGSYEVSYEANGFKKLVRSNVAVEASVPRTLDDKLEIGEVAESITITSGAALITPETSTTFRQLSAEELVAVPTSTRSFTQLLSSDAGVSADLSPVATNGNGNLSPSVNGTRTTSTSLFFNGVDATNITSNEGSLNDNISPAPETLAEVKLQTSLYDASTGRSGGGNFQLITKSGTNDLHGSLYYFLQHDKLNANDFFYNRDGIDRPKARRHEGGFTVGGPVLKDRIFFFAGYQRTDATTGFVPTASSITRLPQALGLIGGPRTAQNIVTAFSSLNPCVRNASNIPQSGFCLTPAQISPISLNLLNLMNPKTGDFFIPSPAANAALIRSSSGAVVTDASTRDPGNIVSSSGALTAPGLFGGNPLVSQRNVVPAQFQQDQINFKMDGQITLANRLSGTIFYANFPALDPFPDPSSLASPVELKRDDRNRTLAITDTHIFSGTLINELRFGFYKLNNTRGLSDEFLPITNALVGVTNPANFFDQSVATTRLGHYIFRNNLSRLSFGGPNDSFNRRTQQTGSVSDGVTLIRGGHTLRFGGDYKSHRFDTNLPEEQATEFEKMENFTQFLAGFTSEADTQFGITDKSFRFRDASAYFADDFKIGRKLTINLGMRYEFFGWPEEQQGRIGNFDFANLNTESPGGGFIVPSNARETGFVAIDAAIATSQRADNKHTLNGYDLNNFAPRFGFAYSPFTSNKMVVRGGYGIFYDRPSAAFINTVFSDYPFLREVEVTAPAGRVPFATAFSQQNPRQPLNQYLPNRVVYGANGAYTIRDATGVALQANGTANPIDLATGRPTLGNNAETFEFRAIDRDLRTPYIQQWNIGTQYEVAKNLLIEVRYVGTKGTKLLQATAFNQSYDLNDPNTPDYIFKRFNDAYQAAQRGNPAALRGPLNNAAATQRARGQGVAYGFPNVVTGNLVDLNLSTPSTLNATTGAISGGTTLPFEARGPILGFNIPEAVLLQSSANSIYHSGQLSVTKRLSQGLQFNVAYTLSKSIDNNSADPGSTAGGGKPDIPNVGFVVQGDQRNLSTNRALSDFDRTHRLSVSYVYDIPTFGRTSRFLTGFQLSGFAQAQSGTPFSIFSGEPEAGNVAALVPLSTGAGGLYRLGFGRPNLCGTLDELREQGDDPTEDYFNRSVLCSPLGGFGSLGRNILRGPSQKRFDLGLSKTTRVTEQVGLELRWDIFNVFNNVNFANPNNDLQDTTDFGTISNTIGGPRVMQFGLKLKF
ncbi:MAG: carboxypeptidase-like regulatory domain-containing protein [Pyrinomonadaceae bacterium]